MKEKKVVQKKRSKRDKEVDAFGYIIAVLLLAFLIVIALIFCYGLEPSSNSSTTEETSSSQSEVKTEGGFTEVRSNLNPKEYLLTIRINGENKYISIKH